MNKMQLCLLVLLTIGGYTTANASANQQTASWPKALSHTEIPAVINNYNLNELVVLELEQRAMLFNEYKDDYIKLFDKLTEPAMVHQQVYLEHLLEKAIFAKLTLPELKNLGLSKNSDNVYSYNLLESPHFVSMNGLLTFLPRMNTIKLKQALIKRGFDPKDTEKLDKALRKYRDQKHGTREDLTTSYETTKQIIQWVENKDNVTKEQYLHFFHYIQYQKDHRIQFTWLNAGLSVISQFSDHSQRVFKSYLIEQLDKDVTLTSHWLENTSNRTTNIETIVYNGTLATELKKLKAKLDKFNKVEGGKHD